MTCRTAPPSPPAAWSGVGDHRRRWPPTPASLQGRGGRIDVEHDLTVAGRPGVYALGDFANIPAPDGQSFPQLGSVALQSGQWSGEEHRGRDRREADRAVPLPRQGHHGHDRSQRGHRRDGRAPPRAPRADRVRVLAGRARLAHDRHPHPHRGLHRLGLGLLLQEPGPQVLDRTDAARIDWDDDEDDDAGAGVPSAEDDVERATRWPDVRSSRAGCARGGSRTVP